MENLGLLERFANPEMLEKMTLGEKFLGSTYIAILGMAITFVALMILWGLIIVMGKVLNTTKPKKKEVNIAKTVPAPKPTPVVKEKEEEPEELVAVITAAIAASLGTSSSNIVVRNIVRVPDTTPAWGRAGRTEQMNRML